MRVPTCLQNSHQCLILTQFTATATLKRTAVIVDDHPIVREGIRSRLETCGFRVVGEADDGLKALNLVRREAPDLVTVDLSLPRVDGLVVVRLVRKQSPDTKILVFSLYDDSAHVGAALHAGADAYVTKSANMEHLVTAFEEVLAGNQYLSPGVKAPTDPDSGEPLLPESGLLKDLSNRERQVFSLVVSGYSSREIGDMLRISQRTVERHRHNLMRKLKVHRLQDLVLLAARAGLLPELNG